ncbi:MAG: hypothetical protein WAM13_08200 [Candidatus Sulfotelmatobacter sp.]|jgi:hypothetical protein
METSWTSFGLTVLAGGVSSSLTDWLFMGDWIYKRFDHSPEIWRYSGGHGETRAIMWASLFPFLTCAVFALLCIRLHLFSYSATIGLALAIWLIGPLPLTMTNALFIKLTLAVATAHSLGWLVKLCLAAIAVVVILG